MTFKSLENSNSNDEYGGSYKILWDSVRHRNFIHYCHLLKYLLIDRSVF